MLKCYRTELMSSHGENSTDTFKRKAHMEVFVEHSVLWRLLGRGLKKFEEKISGSSTGLFHCAYLTPNMLKFGEHKLPAWKLDIKLSDGKTFFICVMLWQSESFHTELVLFFPSTLALVR